MHLTRDILAPVEARYGAPREIDYGKVEIMPGEYVMVRMSIDKKRAHDVTLFIPREDGVVVIRKQNYPRDLYRLPSGAVHPGEDFVEGLRREAREETGLDVEPIRYLLRARVRFTHGSRWEDWTSHVLLARATGGTLQPQDTREIAEARVASPQEFQTTLRRRLMEIGGGFTFRARVQDELVPLFSQSSEAE
ncbi:MAG: NUDIX hydrolase [Euryarchaeota archaeon]|nr:NUDIX hydrolase [Euryarchaeota archaeon]